MCPSQPNEFWYDSDSVLRLVDAAVRDLGVESGRHSPESSPADAESSSASGTPGDSALGQPAANRLMALSTALQDGYAAVAEILSSLRRGRGTIEQVAHEKLQPVHAKLQEASTTTEVAAIDLLDGLERAVSLVDALDEADGHGDRDRAAELRADLRNKLFDLMLCMQFQDITRQQLSFASSVLVDTEHRLAQLANTLEPTATEAELLEAADPAAGTYDPRATLLNREARQAVADQVIATAAPPIDEAL